MANGAAKEYAVHEDVPLRIADWPEYIQSAVTDARWPLDGDDVDDSLERPKV
jgi:hypothetical protein